MNKFRSFRTKHFIIFSVIAVVLIWAVLFRYCVGWSYDAIFEGMNIDDRILEGLNPIYCDGMIILIAALILWASDRLDIFTRKGKGFVHGCKVAAFPLIAFTVAIIFFVVGMVATDPSEAAKYGYEINVTFDFASVLIILSFCFVGLAEEITLRGITAQTLLEGFGTSRAGIWKAAIISGVCFGAIHSINLAHASAGFVIPQMVSAAGGGIFYAAIYFRSGNIWPVVIVHSLNDIMASVSIWLGGGSMGTAMDAAGSTISIFPFVWMIVEVSLAIYLLRPKKIGEVAESWPEIAAKDAETEEPTPAEEA
ncbi:MAG: CPBP family intramembrane metalloprotease [Phoenicibacter congonensis]|uniref:CPBP family intramembrane metalloprotease n=1 Tax=Phoenicibacter congonensis TaxID=1944646 RepID=A0AA43RHS9_9ACTN|nr:CPBP family intramembrane metalloprotease [Phoenicibacter congonensis]